MRISKTKTAILITLFTTSLLRADDLFEASLEDIMQMQSELKADVGSREGAKNFLDSRSPVDVITHEQIERSGLTSLTNVLRYFVAGFNAPETSVADGSDHVRAFTLRGMSPDQILVLINGKRLHASSLLHVNDVIGRGSSNVDLDTISLKAIEKIEILRDGAAAQYGSDAISGVINIILKGIGHSSSIDISVGQRELGDGEKLYTEALFTLPLKYDGFINTTLSLTDQKQTQRAGVDKRLTPPSVKTHAGIPDYQNFAATLNAEIPQKNNINFYVNSMLNYRDSEASAFFRPPSLESATLYPTGFLPIINAKIHDYSLRAGVQGEFDNALKWDFSNAFGYNDIRFHVDESMNYTLGANSPISFSNGGFNFLQNSTNLDLKKSIDRLSLASGFEYRYEKYRLEQGESASFVGTGSQGFSGYRAENEAKESRESYAFYIDGTYNFTDDLSLECASRYENYSDFGSTTNFKLASSYKIIPQLLLRSSASTGFRAPSLAQSNYSHTSTFGGLIEGTFRPEHEIAKTFGAKKLTAEESTHFTIGGVYQPRQDLSLMIDYFLTNVDDRIMLSNNLIGATDAQKRILAAYGVSKARFFTNAIDTKTHGVDIKLNFNRDFTHNKKLNVGIWYNYNKNSVQAFNGTTTTRENSYEQIDRVENGQPKSSLRVLISYEQNKLLTTLNFSGYGSYRQVRDNQAYKFNSKLTSDLDITYKATKKMKLSMGAINLFSTMPNRWNDLSGTLYGYNAIKPYSRYSPFGYSGAFFYVRTRFDF